MTFTFAPRASTRRPIMRYSCAGERPTRPVYTGAELAKGIPLTLKKTPEAELVIYERQPRMGQ